MSKIGWRFPPLSGGNQQGYTNSGIETFKGEELIDNLAREICQNSLDAKDKSSNEPVTVKFTMRKLSKNAYDVFSGFEECIEGCKRYWGDEMDAKLSKFVSGAELTLKESEIPVLMVGDYNTTGLTGIRSKSANTAWSALTRSDGVCVKPGDSSGGSYGIGKNAPFACSSLSMVFYNTVTNENEKAFKGVSRLASIFDENDLPTQGVGHYQNNGVDEWLPIYEEDICPFRDLFTRNEQGTDIIIAGFNEESDWVSKVEKAVLKNFFLAIYENKLVVNIHNDIIDKSTLAEKIKIKYKDDRELRITRQLFEAILNPDNVRQLSILEENDAEVFIKSDKDFARTIANFRTSGMLVGQYYRRILQHYAAVLVIRGEALDVLLKDTEPAKHNRWDYTLIDKNDSIKQGKAKKSIKAIEDNILEILKNQYEVVTEETIDSDTGEYIPDEYDEFGGNSAGDDILRVKQTITKVRVRDVKSGKIQTPGKPGKGIEVKGKINNETINPNPKPGPKPTKPVMPRPGGVDGIVPMDGTKIITMPNFSRQRAFPINSEIGLYKVIVVPEESYSDIYMRFSALREDGRLDFLPIDYYTDSGKKSQKFRDKVGPIDFEKDVPKEIVVCFDIKEKMALNLTITEEKNR